jgi:5-methyltetrahydrofolate--homocysteine methyltransferase
MRDAPTPTPTPRVVPRPAAGPRRDVVVPRPQTWGVHTLAADLPAVWQYLDRNTLFRHHWGGHRARGAEYARIVKDVFEPELARLQADAIEHAWLEARMVSGVFACNADGDALILWSAEQRSELGRLSFPRQPEADRLCLADYFRPVSSGEPDVIVLQAVSVGPRAGAYIEELQRDGDYSRMLYVNGLASSTAEALAEYAHRAARRTLGVPETQGLRFSWGYQACPDLAEQRIVLDVLDAERLIGLRLSESSHLDPEHSTAAMVVHHPEAKYFAIRSSET